QRAHRRRTICIRQARCVERASAVGQGGKRIHPPPRLCRILQVVCGVNDETPEDTKGYDEFPYGDFHRCGVLTAESRAGQYKHYDIESAAAHLHGMLEGRKASSSAPNRSRATSPSRVARGAA